MSGHRWLIISPVLLLLLLSVGCQTDGGSRTVWNPFRKKTDSEALADSEPSSSFSMPRFSRKNEGDGVEDSKYAKTPMAAEQLERLLAQGRVALQDNRLDEAKNAYNEVLESVPDNATAHHGLAMAADLAEKWDDAEYHYRQALRVRPRDPDLLCDIGYSYLLQNRYSESERYLTHALEVSPEHESALMNLAMLDLRQGKRASAERRLADRYGASGKAIQVLAQLDEQVASMGGGVIPASATSNTGATSNANVFRPEMSAPSRSLAGQGGPEIPPTASLEQALEIARREGAEAERRRVLQNIPQEQTPAASWPNAPAASLPVGRTQPAIASPANPGFNSGTSVTVGNQPTGNMNAPLNANSSNVDGNPPRHIFGTLQPRNLNDLNGGSRNYQSAATASPAMSQSQNGIPLQNGATASGNAPIDPAQWSNSRSTQNGGPSTGGMSSGTRISANTGYESDAIGGGFGGTNPGSLANSMGTPASSNGMTSNNVMANNVAGQGTPPASSGIIPNGGAPIAVRSSGAFQSSANTNGSYGVPYGFGSTNGQPPVSTVSNSASAPLNGQPANSNMSGRNNSGTSPTGMYLDGLNVGPGSLFPVYPTSPGANGSVAANGNLQGSGQSMMNNGQSAQPGMPSSGNNSAGANGMGANGAAGNGGLRMGNISSPGTGSMINGAMYSQPDSTLPSAGVMNGGGINSTSNLPGWPGSRPTVTNPLESYERQRQQLDDEYNRTLEQLDRNSPTSSSRAQY